MRIDIRFLRVWPMLLRIALGCGAIVLLWRVRDTALNLAPFWHIDALSAFFLCAICGSAIATRGVRAILSLVLIALALSTALFPIIISGYLLFALLHLDLAQFKTTATTPAPLRTRIGRFFVPIIQTIPAWLAAACVLVGYGMLMFQGALRYDDANAGYGLNSFAFWFVLLAALIPLAPLIKTPTGQSTSAPPSSYVWLYPLVRLYSLGPWNNGWSFATLLLGGAVAFWCASSALVQPQPIERHNRIAALYLALALAGFGLSNSAGIAAGCFGVFTYLVLALGPPQTIESIPTKPPTDPLASLLPWLFSSALPLSGPFVAAWMLMGAAVAGGVALLAGLTWLAALLHALSVALWYAPLAAPVRRSQLIVAGISIGLGVLAPLIVRWSIQPVVAQLQGGLTPYGDLNIWPWVGIAASDSAHTQVTTLPSLAIALLMLVLTALVYVVHRLRTDEPDATLEEVSQPNNQHIAVVLHELRAEVPWLASLLGMPSSSSRPPDDVE